MRNIVPDELNLLQQKSRTEDTGNIQKNLKPADINNVKNKN